MKQIATAGNTAVPALLVLESLGFTVYVERGAIGDLFRAARGEETYVGEDPVAVLGLVKLVEARGWDWQAADSDIDEVLRRYRLG
jgi:hypothetical protein